MPHALSSCSVLVPFLVFACAAAPTRSTEPDRCTQTSVDEARLPAEDWVQKLEPNLSHELFEWRRDAAYARCAGSERSQRVDRRVSVEVEYRGDIESLRAAGLETGLDREGVVSGIIAVSHLESLARLPGVVHIRGEEPAGPATGSRSVLAPRANRCAVSTWAPPGRTCEQVG